MSRLVMRTRSPPRRRRCSTNGAKARMSGLWGMSGLRLSQCRSMSSSWSSASVGSSFARLGVKAWRYRASLSGLLGKSTRPSYFRRASTRGPLLSSRAMAMGWPSKRCSKSVAHAAITAGRWAQVVHARVSEPATCRQTSCCASAQSRPMKAANSCVVPAVMRPLQSVMSVSARDR